MKVMYTDDSTISNDVMMNTLRKRKGKKSTKSKRKKKDCGCGD